MTLLKGKSPVSCLVRQARSCVGSSLGSVLVERKVVNPHGAAGCLGHCGRLHELRWGPLHLRPCRGPWCCAAAGDSMALPGRRSQAALHLAGVQCRRRSRRRRRGRMRRMAGVLKGLPSA